LFAKAGNFAESPHTLPERVAKGDAPGIFNFASFRHFSATLADANNGYLPSVPIRAFNNGVIPLELRLVLGNAG